MAKPIAKHMFETSTAAGATQAPAGQNMPPPGHGAAPGGTPRPGIGHAGIAFGTAAIRADGARGTPPDSAGTSDDTSIAFGDIENIICFTPGTRILTRHGERPVEKLRIGDLAVTRDHGLRPIRWIGQRRLRGTGRFAPITIVTGAAPGADSGLTVSPNHRMLFTGYQAELLFGEREVLVAARHLLNGHDVRRTPRPEVSYIHIMFDRHEVIYAEGMATESFYAGDAALSAIDAPARTELFAIFPELRSAAGEHRITARPCLRRHEARLLIHDHDTDEKSGTDILTGTSYVA